MRSKDWSGSAPPDGMADTDGHLNSANNAETDEKRFEPRFDGSVPLKPHDNKYLNEVYNQGGSTDNQQFLSGPGSNFEWEMQAYQGGNESAHHEGSSWGVDLTSFNPQIPMNGPGSSVDGVPIGDDYAMNPDGSAFVNIGEQTNSALLQPHMGQTLPNGFADDTMGSTANPLPLGSVNDSMDGVNLGAMNTMLENPLAMNDAASMGFMEELYVDSPTDPSADSSAGGSGGPGLDQHLDQQYGLSVSAAVAAAAEAALIGPDSSKNDNSKNIQINDKNTEEDPDGNRVHRRDFSDTSTMNAPLVSSAHNDDYDINHPGSAGYYQVDPNVIQTPIRGFPNQANFGNVPGFYNANPNLDHQSQGSSPSYLLRGLESPSESPALQSPNTISGFPFPQGGTPTNVRRSHSMIASPRVQRSMSAASQMSSPMSDDIAEAPGEASPQTPRVRQRGVSKHRHRKSASSISVANKQTPKRMAPQTAAASAMANTSAGHHGGNNASSTASVAAAVSMGLTPGSSAGSSVYHGYTPSGNMPSLTTPIRGENNDAGASTGSPMMTGNTSPSKIKRESRRRVTQEHVNRLEEAFAVNTRPSAEECEHLAEAIQLDVREVTSWFHKRRLKDRAQASSNEGPTSKPGRSKHELASSAAASAAASAASNSPITSPAGSIRSKTSPSNPRTRSRSGSNTSQFSTDHHNTMVYPGHGRGQNQYHESNESGPPMAVAASESDQISASMDGNQTGGKQVAQMDPKNHNHGQNSKLSKIDTSQGHPGSYPKWHRNTVPGSAATAQRTSSSGYHQQLTPHGMSDQQRQFHYMQRMQQRENQQRRQQNHVPHGGQMMHDAPEAKGLQDMYGMYQVDGHQRPDTLDRQDFRMRKAYEQRPPSQHDSPPDQQRQQQHQHQQNFDSHHPQNASFQFPENHDASSSEFQQTRHFVPNHMRQMSHPIGAMGRNSVGSYSESNLAGVGSNLSGDRLSPRSRHRHYKKGFPMREVNNFGNANNGHSFPVSRHQSISSFDVPDDLQFSSSFYPSTAPSGAASRSNSVASLNSVTMFPPMHEPSIFEPRQSSPDSRHSGMWPPSSLSRSHSTVSSHTPDWAGNSALPGEMKRRRSLYGNAVPTVSRTSDPDCAQQSPPQATPSRTSSTSSLAATAATAALRSSSRSSSHSASRSRQSSVRSQLEEANHVAHLVVYTENENGQNEHGHPLEDQQQRRQQDLTDRSSQSQRPGINVHQAIQRLSALRQLSPVRSSASQQQKADADTN